MVIEKKYHFYAAHRNKEAGVKCGRIHGHTYDVVCHFKFDYRGEINMLFSDIDNIVEPIIKRYDHYLILDSKEHELIEALNSIKEEYIVVPFETSAENMAIFFFNEIASVKLPIVKIEINETKSSKVVYEPIYKV